MSFIDIEAPVGFECGFQSNLDFMNKKYCFKYEYADNGKRCMIVGDDKRVFLEWFRQLPEHQRKMYELIRYDDIVAEYYDIDLKIDENTNPEMVEDMSNEIIYTLLETRNEISQQTISKKDIIVLSAHTPTKLSLHIVSKKTYFMNNRLHRIFALDVYNKLLEEEPSFNIDTSVYSNNRCFRMYLNHKYEKDNTLVLFNPDMYSYATFEETWVVLTHQNLDSRIEIQKYTEDDLTILQYHDNNEELTEDLDKLLRDFIEKYPYFQVETDRSRRVNRINRIDNATRPCLTDPSDSHSMENMYWYIHNHSLYVGCFCKKGKHICLGMRSGIHKIELEPQTFKYATHSSDDFKDYSDFKRDISTIYDKRRTGKGKTTCAMKYSENFEKVLLVHHRLSLDDDYIQKYPNFTSYQSNVNSDKQTVCFNSLNRIDITKYDLIIIDEIRSILKQTEMKDMVYSTHTLFNIMENLSIPLIMLDANMTNDDIDFISKHRIDTDRIVIHDTNVATTKNVFIIGRDEMEVLAKIDKKIRKGEKVVIAYNKSIEKMNGLLAQYEEEYRILHINKLTRKSVDMDSDTWYDKFDIIAYSPTISEGVSVNDVRFKTVNAYGLFTSTSCPAESVSQMIARFRAVDNFTIHLCTKHTKSIPLFYKKADVLKYVNNNINKLYSISQSHCNLKREGSNIVIIEDEFCELFCKNLLENSLDYHNYQDTLIQKLVNNGYNIYVDLNDELSVEETTLMEEHVNELKNVERARMNKLILESPTLSHDEYTRLKDIGVSCEEDECKIEKYNILCSINMSSDFLDTNIVNTYRKPDIRYKIRNIKYCFGFIRNDIGEIERIPTRVLIKENASTIMHDFDKRTTFLDQKKCITQFSPTKLEWLDSRVSELGFSYLLSPESIDLDIFQTNMKRIINYYSDTRNYTDYANSELLFGRYFSRPKQVKLTEKFITDKLLNMFAFRFGKDKKNNKVYQQIGMSVRLYDPTRETPNILGGIILPDEITSQYSNMFMRGNNSNYCEVCDKTLPHGVGFVHLNSNDHLKNLKK